MTRGGNLGELEQVLLLALLRLGDGAYGAGIRREVFDRTGRSITPGTIYPTLQRLESKGFVASYRGDPSSVRGGRSRRHYTLQPEGLAVLRQSWSTISRLADGCLDVLESEGP